MRVRDGRQHLHDECDALGPRESVAPREYIDALSLDVLPYQIRLTGCGHAGIQEARNAWVAEIVEHGAFASEAFLPGGAQRREVEELDGGVPLESIVGSAREPYRAHFALAKLPLERIGTNPESAKRKDDALAV